MQDLPTSPAGSHVPVTATTGAPPQRPLGRTVLVPVAVLAGIAIAVATSAGTAHARWGILGLLLPVLLIARRMAAPGAPRGQLSIESKLWSRASRTCGAGRPGSSQSMFRRGRPAGQATWG